MNNIHGLIGTGLILMLTASALLSAESYSFSPKERSDTWRNNDNPYFKNGFISAVQGDEIQIKSRWDRYAPAKSLDMLEEKLHVAKDCKWENFPENRSPAVGDEVYIYMQKTDMNTAQEIWYLSGAQVSQRKIGDYHMPDKNGCVFFDDFSDKNLSKWSLRYGHVDIVQDKAVTDNGLLSIRKKDYGDVCDKNFNQELWLHDFPRMDEVWFKWRIKLHDVETYVKFNRPSAFALFRPFHYNHSEVFAVLLHEQVDHTFRLDVQWGKRPRGNIVIQQDKWYTLKFHWKRSTDGAEDGIIETWVDGVADIQTADEKETTAGHFFDRLAMGFMHCGHGTAKVGMVYMDDIWIGIKNPDQMKQGAESPNDSEVPAQLSAVTVPTGMTVPPGSQLLWDGEDVSNEGAKPYLAPARRINEHAHTGEHALYLERGTHKYPEFLLRKGVEINSAQELWFWIKADKKTEEFLDVTLFSSGGFTSINIGPYIQGGVLDTTYRLVKLPTAGFFKDTFDGKRVQIFGFGGKPWPVEPYTYYIDDVYLVNPESKKMINRK